MTINFINHINVDCANQGIRPFLVGSVYQIDNLIAQIRERVQLGNISPTTIKAIINQNLQFLGDGNDLARRTMINFQRTLTPANDYYVQEISPLITAIMTLAPDTAHIGEIVAQINRDAINALTHTPPQMDKLRVLASRLEWVFDSLADNAPEDLRTAMGNYTEIQRCVRALKERLEQQEESPARGQIAQAMDTIVRDAENAFTARDSQGIETAACNLLILEGSLQPNCTPEIRQQANAIIRIAVNFTNVQTIARSIRERLAQGKETTERPRISHAIDSIERKAYTAYVTNQLSDIDTAASDLAVLQASLQPNCTAEVRQEANAIINELCE